MKCIFVAAALAMAVTGVAASAQEAREAQEEAQPEKKICRTNKSTGSLTRRTRICLTRAQWNELSARTRRGVDEMNSSASGAPACISTHDTACGTAAGPGGIPGL